MLDDTPDEGFVEEFSKLEEMLRQQDASASDTAGEDKNTDAGEEKENKKDKPEDEN